MWVKVRMHPLGSNMMLLLMFSLVIACTEIRMQLELSTSWGVKLKLGNENDISYITQQVQQTQQSSVVNNNYSDHTIETIITNTSTDVISHSRYRWV